MEPVGADAVANAGTSAPNGASGALGGTVGDMIDPVGDADAAPAMRGTRLRAKSYVGEDGSKQFVGWHDVARNEDCSIAAAGEGKLRCMPGASAYISGYFSDPSWTTQLLYTFGTGIVGVAFTDIEVDVNLATAVAHVR